MQDDAFRGSEKRVNVLRPFDSPGDESFDNDVQCKFDSSSSNDDDDDEN